MSDTTQVQTCELTGIPSGDHELFCWDVTAAEFRHGIDLPTLREVAAWYPRRTVRVLLV